MPKSLSPWLIPRSLRFRLILSFGLLIFVSLFLAGTFTVYLLREQAQERAEEKVGLLAEPVALRSAFLELSGASPAQISEVLNDEYPDVRILLVDNDAMVVADTEDTLRGSSVSQVIGGAPSANSEIEDARYQVRSGPEDLLFFYATPRGFVPVTFTPSFQTVVAVEASDVRQAWQDLLPRLFLAGGVAALTGVLAASLLMRGVTRPLREMTVASEEMAQGRYDQQIPERGGEEVRRLGRAFNDMARQVSRSHRTLRDFLANVSHELKTPLTSIQGFSQAMVDGSLNSPEAYSEAGRIINDEAVRMRGLVDDLLYLSQVDSGEFRIQPDDMAPNELLQATRERFARRAEQSGVELITLPQPTPRINADGRRLEQALANIVDNAVRHTPSGGRVTLRSHAENGHIELSVHNTGPVIPPDALPHIFERFFQADPTGASKDANTGLGLAITREIVEAHGGDVTAVSNQEQGTEFVITLPVPKDAPPPIEDAVWARPEAEA
ncbi:MAG TPA: HAMP domain-containing sensor histidine kinase [Dehalococcoidia bacterium]|nr:HAMP domain-containing sensor histidine kinase [Dehalococcoidia bacterium]